LQQAKTGVYLIFRRSNSSFKEQSILLVYLLTHRSKPHGNTYHPPN
jgi:hypothetical protein